LLPNLVPAAPIFNDKARAIRKAKLNQIKTQPQKKKTPGENLVLAAPIFSYKHAQSTVGRVLNENPEPGRFSSWFSPKEPEGIHRNDTR
jgi:hypothetical protein